MDSNDGFFGFMGLAKALVTSNRPLRLRLDLPGGLNDDMLLPQRVTGTETLCGGIEYRVLCVSPNVSLPLKQLIAVPAALAFVTDSGGLRSVCGIVTQAASGDSDGGLASYQLVIRDALAVLEKRTNTRVFRNMNEVEIVQRLLNEWRQKSPTLGACFVHVLDDGFAQRDYPPREFTMQHNESDAAFIRRLLARRGIGWYVRPGSPSSEHDSAAGTPPMHTLVLFNNADSLRENAAGTVRYHRDGATEESDTITSWSAVRTLQPGAVTRHSWDYRNPLGRDFMMMEAASAVDQGMSGNELAASLDDYQVLNPHAGDDHEDLCRLGQLRMSRHDYESKCFHGEGSVRDFCAGEWFALTGHPEIDGHPPEEREFVVTALHLTAHNNLPGELAARVARLFARSCWTQDDPLALRAQECDAPVPTGPMRVQMQFTAVRRGVTIIPSYDPRTDLPAAPMQSAIVVGPQGEEVHCDQLGRVKIRFPATRAADHEAAAGSGASDSDSDSAWVRVASNWAGNGPGSLHQCGTVGLPRIGTEVLVNFLGGDPDRPVIVGQLYNQVAQPAALNSMDVLPGNRNLSGMRSREIHGDRSNQLRFDDTQGEISAQLASDHGGSQLNLGFLTKQRLDGSADCRGEGSELRSEKAVAIRGVRGVLVTGEDAEANDSHLERTSMLSLIKNLNDIAVQLCNMAIIHARDKSDSEYVSKLIQSLQNMEKLEAAIVAIFGPDGIAISSGANLFLDALHGIDLVSKDHANIGTSGGISLRAGDGISLFSNKEGAKLIAATGKILLQAQNDETEILSQKSLDIISVDDWVNLSAKQGIRITAGGSEIIIDAQGIKGFCNGIHEIHASSHQFFGRKNGLKNLVQVFPQLSKILNGKTWVEISLLNGDIPVAGARYVLTDANGEKHKGNLDEKGFARVDSIAFGHCKLVFPELGQECDLNA